MKIDFDDAIKTLGVEVKKSNDTYHARFKKSHRLNFTNKKQAYFLSNGSVSICRIKDDMLILSLESPTMIGLSFINEFTPYHYIRCKSECEFYIIDLDSMIHLIDTRNLWQEAFFNMTELAQKYMSRESQTLQKNVYGIVFEHLRAIWALDEDVRGGTSVYNYILERNPISRRAIYNVVSNLKEQNVIDIERGKLIAFNDRRNSQ